MEHSLHTSHATGVPPANVPIEGRSTIEHSRHICDVASVPIADVLIESYTALKCAAHICNVFRTPLADMTVRIAFAVIEPLLYSQLESGICEDGKAR